jgi:ferric iron reductase protein FhuF
VYREAVERHLIPLGEALCRVVPLSRHIRRGNVASALAAAAAMLGASDPAGRAGTDPVGGRARAILRALLEDGPLRTAGTLEPAGPGAPPFFLRHNCCLYYRIPGGGTCGDCVLAAPPGSRDASRRARPRDAHA